MEDYYIDVEYAFTMQGKLLAVLVTRVAGRDPETLSETAQTSVFPTRFILCYTDTTWPYDPSEFARVIESKILNMFGARVL